MKQVLFAILFLLPHLKAQLTTVYELAVQKKDGSVTATSQAATATVNRSLITITATYASAPVSPTATFADLGNNKRIGFMFTKDDGSIGDYNSILPVINGGYSPLDGTTHPGFTYSDGAGGKRKWGYSFAINGRGNALRDGSNPTVTTWNEYKNSILPNDNFILSNHTADHTNVPTALYQLRLNDSIIKAKLNVNMRTIVIPGGLGGFVAAGIQLKDILWSSEGYGGPDNPSADGYDAEISWGDTYDIPTLLSDPRRHLIGSRHNLDAEWITGLAAAKSWVDSKFIQARDSHHKQVFSAFAHGPGTAAETRLLEQLLTYIQTNPLNKNEVWFPNLQQFAEYLEVTRVAVKSPLKIAGNTVTLTLDLKNVPATNKYKDISLLLSGGTLENVVVTGSAKTFDFNSSTGLVNIYNGSTATGTRPVLH